MKYKKKIALCLVLSAVMLSGCGGSEEAEETAAEESYTAVQTETLGLSSISKNLSYQGYVEAKQTVNVTSKISGIVENVYFDEGDYVQKGQTLFTIDQKDILDNIASLEASLKINEQSVASAQTGVNQANDSGSIQSNRSTLENAVKSAQINVETCETSLETAKTSLETAEASLANAEKTYNDTKTLYEAGVASKSSFDSAELAYTQAKNAKTQAEQSELQAEKALTNAKNTYEQAVESLDIFNNSTTEDSKTVAQDSLNTAIASKEATQTSIDIARSSLADTTVVAPISGYISSRNIEPTNMVSSSSQPFTIVDVSTVSVYVNVSEKLINTINVGDKVDVVIEALENSDITGTVKTVSPVVDSTSTYPVKIEIDNPDGLIKAGMFAKVNFVETQSGDTIVLPVDAVLESGGQSYVYSVDENSRAYKINVETGLDNGTDVQITSGLNAGDTVIISGQNYVEDGTLVKVVTDEEDTSEADTENETEN